MTIIKKIDIRNMPLGTRSIKMPGNHSGSISIRPGSISALIHKFSNGMCMAISKHEKLNLIMLMCGELGKPPEALNTSDFRKKLNYFNNKGMNGLLYSYMKEGISPAGAISALKADLGIQKDHMSMFMNGALHWDQASKEEMLNIIMVMCGELGKLPEALNAGDFGKQLKCLNGKCLDGLLYSYQKEGKSSVEALYALKADLGIQEDYISMFMNGRLYWDQIPREVKLNFVMLMCGEIGKPPEALNTSDFRKQLKCLNSKCLHGLMGSYQKNGMSMQEALYALKDDLGIHEDHISMFINGELHWDQALKDEKLNFIMLMCGEIGKPPEALNTSDFFKKLKCLNGKSLAGLENSYKKEGKGMPEALSVLKADLGINEDPIEMCRNGNLYWDQVSQDVKLNFVMLMCGELGKTPDQLETSDFIIPQTYFGGKSMIALLKSFSDNGKDQFRALLEIKAALLSGEDQYKKFINGQMRWENVSKQVKKNFLMLLCGERGRSPEALNLGDFNKPLKCLGGKTLDGLQSSYRKNDMSDVEALAAMKADLGIKMDYVAMFKENEHIRWDQVPRAVKLNIIMMMCGELRKSPESINSGDFGRKLKCFNNKVLVGMLQSTGISSNIDAIDHLKNELGIGVNNIQKFIESGKLHWAQVPRKTKKNIIMLMCGELGKSPEEMNTGDFTNHKYKCLGNRSLTGFLTSYDRGHMTLIEYLSALKKDLDINENYFAMFMKGNINWEQVPNDVRKNFIMLMCGELNTSPSAINNGHFVEPLRSLGGKTLGGMMNSYISRGLSRGQAVTALKRDLGIAEDHIAMFINNGGLTWSGIPKEVKLNLIMLMCGALGKYPELLNTNDFHAKLKYLGNKTLNGLLNSYQKEGMNTLDALKALKEDLGIYLPVDIGQVTTAADINMKIREIGPKQRPEKASYISIGLITAVSKWLGISGWPAEVGPFSGVENKYTIMFREKLKAEGIVYPEQLLEKLNSISDMEIEMEELMSAVKASAIKEHFPSYSYGELPDLGYSDHVFSSYQANVLRLLYLLSGHTAEDFQRYNGRTKGKHVDREEVIQTLEAQFRKYNGIEVETSIDGEKKKVKAFYYPVNGSEYEIMYSLYEGGAVFYEKKREGGYKEADYFENSDGIFCPPSFYDRATKTAITIFGRDFLKTRIKIMMLNEHYMKPGGPHHVVIDQLDYLYLIREHREKLFEYYRGIFKEQKETQRFTDGEFAKIVFDFKRFIEDLGIKISDTEMIFREGLPIELKDYRLLTKGKIAYEELIDYIDKAKSGVIPRDAWKRVRETCGIRKSYGDNLTIVEKLNRIATRRHEMLAAEGKGMEEVKPKPIEKEKRSPKAEARDYKKMGSKQLYDEFSRQLGLMKKIGGRGKNIDLFIAKANEIVKLAREGKLTEEQKQEFVLIFKDMIANFSRTYTSITLDLETRNNLSGMADEKLKKVGMLRIRDDNKGLTVYMPEVAYELTRIYYEMCKRIRIHIKQASWMRVKTV